MRRKNGLSALVHGSLRVEFQGASDLRRRFDSVRELDERLGLSELMDRHLSDSRRTRISNCLWPTWCAVDL